MDFSEYFTDGAENIKHQFNTITPSLTQRGDGLAPQHNLHVPSATAHNVKNIIMKINCNKSLGIGKIRMGDANWLQMKYLNHFPSL